LLGDRLCVFLGPLFYTTFYSFDDGILFETVRLFLGKGMMKKWLKFYDYIVFSEYSDYFCRYSI